MNHDYLIEIAMDAYSEASGQSVSRPWMEAAFNTIAPLIWDDGYDAGRDEDDGGGRLHPNPYNRNENA